MQTTSNLGQSQEYLKIINKLNFYCRTKTKTEFIKKNDTELFKLYKPNLSLVLTWVFNEGTQF